MAADDTVDPYSAYETDYVAGVFAGSPFTYTSVPGGASFSSYVVDYDYVGVFAGEKFFFTDVSGQSYTTEEIDFDAQSKLSRIFLGGFKDAPYVSLEFDYTASTYQGYKAAYNLSGMTFASEVIDVTAAGQISKVIYSGLTGTPYQSVEQDYSRGALVAARSTATPT